MPPPPRPTPSGPLDHGAILGRPVLPELARRLILLHEHRSRLRSPILRREVGDEIEEVEAALACHSGGNVCLGIAGVVLSPEYHRTGDTVSYRILGLRDLDFEAGAHQKFALAYPDPPDDEGDPVPPTERARKPPEFTH